jgi:DNA primase small subunit
MQNHLLKSPFCIHPKTGRCCVPIDITNVDGFDPFQVPTLSQLIQELDEYHSTTTAANNVDDDGDVKHEWEKTSLKPYLDKFQKDFLGPLQKELHRTNRDRAEQVAAMKGEF